METLPEYASGIVIKQNTRRPFYDRLSQVRFKQVKRVLPVFPVHSFLTMNQTLLLHRHGHHHRTT